MDHTVVACAFDLMMLDGDDLRRRPLSERKAALRKVLRRTKGGIQYVEHTEGDGAKMFEAVCKLGLEAIVSKRIDAPYRSGPSKSWIKVKNPKAAAAMRVIEGAFDRDRDADELKSQLAGNRFFGTVCRKLGRSAGKLGQEQDGRSALRIHLRGLSQIAAKRNHGPRNFRARKLPARTLYHRP
jgi:hypothetical protein